MKKEQKADSKDSKKSKPKEYKKLMRENEQLTNQLKRALSDYQNFKKRVYQEKQTFTLTANMGLLLRAVEVLDDLELSLSKFDKEEKGSSWIKGIEMIREKMVSILKSQSVTLIEAKEGDKFSPEVHESVGIVTVKDEDQENTIIGIARKGYKINEKVLRPTRVVIGSFNK